MIYCDSFCFSCFYASSICRGWLEYLQKISHPHPDRESNKNTWQWQIDNDIQYWWFTSGTSRCLLMGLNPPNWGCGNVGKFCCCLFCEAEGGEDSSRWVAAEEGPSLNTVAGGPGLCTGTEPGDVWLEAAGLGRTSNLAAVSIRTGNKLSRLKFHNNGEGHYY